MNKALEVQNRFTWRVKISEGPSLSTAYNFMSFTSRSPTLFSLWTSEEKPLLLLAGQRTGREAISKHSKLCSLFCSLQWRLCLTENYSTRALSDLKEGNSPTPALFGLPISPKRGKTLRKICEESRGTDFPKDWDLITGLLNASPQHTLHALLQTQDYKWKNCKAQILHRKEILGKHKHNREAKNKDNWWNETSDTYSYSWWRNS